YSRNSYDLPPAIQSASFDPRAPCANILESGPPSMEMNTWPDDPSPVSHVTVVLPFPPPEGTVAVIEAALGGVLVPAEGDEAGWSPVPPHPAISMIRQYHRKRPGRARCPACSMA